MALRFVRVQFYYIIRVDQQFALYQAIEFMCELFTSYLIFLLSFYVKGCHTFDTLILFNFFSDPLVIRPSYKRRVTEVVNLTHFLHESGRRGGVNFLAFCFSVNS